MVHLLALRGPCLYRVGTQAAFLLRELRDSAPLSETTDSPRVDVQVVVDWRRISLDFLANRRIVSGRFAELAGSDISDGWQDKRLRFSITP